MDERANVVVSKRLYHSEQGVQLRNTAFKLTSNADRLPVTSVDGLSCTKVSLRWTGRLSDHSLSSFSRVVSD